MEETITFDQLLYLFDTAYAVDLEDRVMFVSLEEGEEEGTYEIYCEDDTFTITREDNETVKKLTYTYMVNIKSDWDGETRETEVRFLKLI
jgi:hypothetical protein